MCVCVAVPESQRPPLQWYGFGGLRNVSFSIGNTYISAEPIVFSMENQ